MNRYVNVLIKQSPSLAVVNDSLSWAQLVWCLSVRAASCQRPWVLRADSVQASSQWVGICLQQFALWEGWKHSKPTTCNTATRRLHILHNALAINQLIVHVDNRVSASSISSNCQADGLHITKESGDAFYIHLSSMENLTLKSTQRG